MQSELRLNNEGIPYHVQSIELVHTDPPEHQKVNFTLCTGQVRSIRLSTIDPTYSRDAIDSKLDEAYLGYLALLLEQFIESELGLFYPAGLPYE